MTAPVRVLVVDDDALVRKGLTLLLGGASDIEVVGEAADGDAVPDAVAATSPDVVLNDIRMPRVDGVAATRRLRARPDAPEVVVLTTFDTDANVLAAIRAGATGFLVKDTPPGEVVESIRKVAQGDPILSSGATRRLLDRALLVQEEREEARRVLAKLSEREREVAQAIARGAVERRGGRRPVHECGDGQGACVPHLHQAGLTNRTQIAILAHQASQE